MGFSLLKTITYYNTQVETLQSKMNQNSNHLLVSASGWMVELQNYKHPRFHPLHVLFLRIQTREQISKPLHLQLLELAIPLVRKQESLFLVQVQATVKNHKRYSYFSVILLFRLFMLLFFIEFWLFALHRCCESDQ